MVAAQLRSVLRGNVNKLKPPVIKKLSRYAWLEINEPEDRKWIRVVYKHEAYEVVGWVSRSMAGTAVGR